MYTRETYLPIIVALIVLGLQSGHTQDISFAQLTTSYTNCILRDHDGFIWIGTQDGLMRYDANEFRTFRNHPDKPSSIPNNFIWCLEQDSKDRIWIGTFGGGIAMWDKYSEAFTTFHCEPPGPGSVEANTIRALHLRGDTLLLLGTERGIRGFDIVHLQFKKGGIWDTLSNLNWFVYAISVSENGEIFVGTENGLYAISETSGPEQMRRLDLPGDDAQTIPDVLIHDGAIYVGSENGLLISSDFLHFDNHFEKHGQPVRRVQEVFVDVHDDIWLATQQGLARYSNEDSYRWFNADPRSVHDLKSEIIHCIAEAEDGILMAGTRQGVHQFSINPPLFRNLNHLYENTGCSRIALGMAEDHDGNIWVCSRGGLMKISISENMKDWSAKCYLPENSSGMMNAYTINITRDRNNDLWVAYRYGGFSKLHFEGDVMIWSQYPKTVALFDGEGVNQIYQDEHKDYWIATRGFGLMKFFPDRDSVKVYGAADGLSHPYVFRIYEDSKQQMWLATANGGLCMFDRRTERFTCHVNDRSDPNSISSNMVLAVSEDSTARLWVCTVDGLSIMEGEAGDFSVLTTMDGLPNNVIYAALEDRDGRLWLSTNEGIVRIQYTDEIGSIDIFDERDGIPGQEFNQHAFLRHSSGVFLFGSIDGIAVWNPGDILASAYHPRIVLTDLLLFNESVAVMDSGIFSLDTNINDIKDIVLKYNQNSLAFKFSALGYAHSKFGSYAYQMEGVDEDWIKSGDRRYVSYSGLAPGHYVFSVNVCNRDGIWNEEMKSVRIRILPPPWKTWWAYIIYGLLILGAVYGVVWAQVERSRAIERARAAERDQFRKKMARDFHDEAGNKITLLSLLTDRAKKKSEENPEVKRLLVELQDCIQDLRGGMRDFIWIMDPSRDTLFDAVVRFRDFADKVCEQAEVEFHESGRTETLRDIIMPGNVRRHFLLIFKEAINNSLKYSKAHHIVFNVRKHSSQQWEFWLEDDGKGFDVSGPPDGYGLANMKARAAQINGELSVHSQSAKGTIVRLIWNSQSKVPVQGYTGD